MTVKRNLSDEIENSASSPPRETSTNKEIKLNQDRDLEYLFETVDISAKSQRLLSEQHVTNIATLLAKASELEQASLPRVNMDTQHKLHKFCLWHHHFVNCHEHDVDWTGHFHEDSLVKFDASDNSGGLLDSDLEFICDVIDMTKTTRKQIAALGITNLACLLNKQDELELFSLDGVKQPTQKCLLDFCLWHEFFCKTQPKETDWKPSFNGKVLATFERESGVERSYRMSLARLHNAPEDGGITNLSEAVIDHCARITTNFLTKRLLEECQGKFDPYDVAQKCAKALMHPTNSPYETIHLVSGKTQAGKSSVKAVCAAVHRQLSCLLVVITKGIAERDDLQIKLNKLLGGCRETMHNGLLVIADTGAQIQKAIKSINEIREGRPNQRFGVIVDEADAMYRTKDAAQIMEQRFAALMELGPSFRMEVSATIFSTLQALEEQGKSDIKMMEVLSADDYSGIHQMEHFKDEEGRDVFLTAEHIKPSYSGVGSVRYYAANEIKNHTTCQSKALYTEDQRSSIAFAVPSGRIIPYTSQPMMQMIGKALEADKKGTLILVGTNPRVYADGNVFVQAACIQNHFRANGKDTATLVATGRGMYYRLPGRSRARFIAKRLKSVSEIIEMIDSVVGLDVPVIIFGYSRLTRCVSFRSASRVPTHLILNRGPGYSLEDYIQAVGRATFNGLSVLRQNGHSHVTILTYAIDFDAAKRYYTFLQEIFVIARENPGSSPLEAFRAATKKLPDEANFFRKTNRKIGRRKDLSSQCSAFNGFEAPSSHSLSDADKASKERYWEDHQVQGVLKAYLELAEAAEDTAHCCSAEELLFRYNDMNPSGGEIHKPKMTQILTQLVNDVVFNKKVFPDSKKPKYLAKNFSFLKEYLVNEDLDEPEEVFGRSFSAPF